MQKFLDTMPSDFEETLAQARAMCLRSGKQPEEIAGKIIEGLNEYSLIGFVVMSQVFLESLSDEDTFEELPQVMYLPGWSKVFTDGYVLYGPISDARFMTRAFERLIEVNPLDAEADSQTAAMRLPDELQASLLSPGELSALTLRPSPPELEAVKPIEVFDHLGLVSRMSELFWNDEWQEGKPGKYQSLASALPDLVKAMNDEEVLQLARLVDEWLEQKDMNGCSCHEIFTYADIPSPNSMWVSDGVVYSPITNAACLRLDVVKWASDHARGNFSGGDESLGQLIYDAFEQACMEIGIGSVEVFLAFSELDQEESRRLRIASNKILEGAK